MAIPISILRSLLTQGAVQGGRRAITGSGGKVLRSGVQAGAQQAAQGGGLLAGAGGLISSYAIFDLMGQQQLNKQVWYTLSPSINVPPVKNCTPGD